MILPNSIDFSSLTSPVSGKELKDYKKQFRVFDITLFTAAIFCAVIIFALVTVWASEGFAGAWGLLLFVSVAAALFGSFYWTYRKRLARSVRFKRFAEANDMHYLHSMVPTEQGRLFQLGRNKHADHVITGSYQGHPFWLGTYYYTIGSGKSSRIEQVGVLNVKLPRAVPYVLLEGKQNSLSLASGIDRSQRLQLEGDFNKYFTVYCPKDYERDVLYFLTPELMQALVDMDDMFDVEIVGDELYFYVKKDVAPTPAMLQNLFDLIEKVSGEIVENTKRYQDYRIDRKIASVAEAGLQLKKSIWPTVIGVLLFIAYLWLSFT